MTGIIKAVIYCRVSTAGQEAEGHGLESQEARCRQYAAARGYEVVAVFPDTKSGGGDFMKRPGMVALLSYLDAHPGERFVVIFDDLKRFARDRDFHFRLRAAMQERDAVRECLNFKFEDTPEGEFIETIMAAQGQLERQQNARQVAQKMKARMQAGYWIHNPPVGYRYETIRGHGKVLVPNPPLSELVREALEGFAMGRFQTQVEAKRFFEAHPAFPRNRKGEITQQRVTDILTQPLYTGHICSERYGIHWLRGHHEPLISVDTFERIQERRAGGAKAPTRKNLGEDFALRGFVCCDDCGQPYTACWSTGNTKKYPYYLCDTKGCPSYRKSVRRERIEGEFEAILKALQPARRLMTCVTAMVRAAWSAREAQAKRAAVASKRDLTVLDKQIDGLLVRIVDATNPAVIDAYETKIADLQKQRALISEKTEKTTTAKGSVEDFIELALSFLANPWNLWKTGDMTLRRTVLKLAFAERPTYCRKEGYQTPKTTLPFKVLAGFSTDESGLVRSRRLELPRVLPHSDLNAARLPIPPRPHVVGCGE